MPHPPQLFESVCWLKHPAAPHEVWPVGHAHTPERHVWPGLHARPHMPQLLKSDMRFTQPMPVHDV